MVMGIFWTLMVTVSLVYGAVSGRLSAVTAAALEGAAAAVELVLVMAGALCLWSGVLELMRRSGMAAGLSRLLRPVLRRLLPQAGRDEETLAALSANVSANLLGLGNAATPAGIQAAKRMAVGCGGTASDELCRLVVLNTASVQLLPTTVAALRAGLGADSPFEILPAVWVSSVCSVAVGLLAWLMGGSALLWSVLAGAVVLAAGAVRDAKLPGEAELLGRGVSYCATCDGMLYRGKPGAVVGYTDTARQEAELDHEIISSVSRLYFSIFRIDLKEDFYEEISSDNSVHRLTGHRGMAQQKLNELCSTFVDPEYRLAVRQFFDLSTVPDRLADTDTVGMDYLATNGNWYMARFIEKRRDEAGRVTHILYVTRNVTKEKRQELERQKLKIAYQATEKANEAKTAFLLNMSHDIRTPMNAILGYAHLMRKELTDPKLLHYQEMIEESGSLLLSIINNVLDMTKIESGRLELNEDYNRVGDVVGKIVAVFQGEARKKNLTLTRVQKATNLDILCDVTKLQELFTNLISNAVKYTPPGGTVTVTTEELPCAQPGHVTLRTEVADTGIGISREFLPHLFEPFSRERNTTAGKVLGTGLGMPIVRSLVELMGGTITVESEQGKGSKFTVTLTHKLAD